MRIALGASRRTVFWLVLKQALETATIGATIGLCAAVASQKLTSGVLFGISPVDPSILVVAATFLLAVAALASAIPAKRVLQIDPAGALRQRLKIALGPGREANPDALLRSARVNGHIAVVGTAEGPSESQQRSISRSCAG